MYHQFSFTTYILDIRGKLLIFILKHMTSVIVINQNHLWCQVLEGLNYHRTYLTLLTMYIEIYLPSPLFISIYNIWTMLCIKCIMIKYCLLFHYCHQFVILLTWCQIAKFLRLLKSYESRNRNFNKLTLYRLIRNWI